MIIKDMQKLTKRDVEGLRGELFHMIIFSIPWALMAEYLLNFSDHFLGAGLFLIVYVCLGLYSVKLYDLENGLSDDAVSENDAKELKRYSLYALIVVFEGIAILATWILMLKFGHDNWLISSFAMIACLHFFPLARLIGLRSYYILGAWLCVLAVVGYLLLFSGKMTNYGANALVAYGCAAGAAVDGIGIMIRTRIALKRQKFNK
jgi:hypothetical protein